jgi:DNA-binding CsgD family transcriptional regulator
MVYTTWQADIVDFNRTGLYTALQLRKGSRSMTTTLLERDPFLLTLDTLLPQAARGLGRTVLVSGEAGIGKTSVVERFLEQHQSSVRPLWGSCEALFTPRPLGPLYDLAQRAQTSLRTVLEHGANRATLFAAVLDELAYGSLPTVVVIEDIHWADEATLDLIKFLARRIQRTQALLILTYRDDELGAEHPLHLVLGDLPARDVTRLRLPPLSEAAVTALAQHAGRPGEKLYSVTGGNPFFLTEVLASPTTGVPTSVRDAVLTQVARLSQQARSVLEVVAVVPTKIEWWALEAISRSAAPGIGETTGQAWQNWLEECLAAGMVHLEEGGAVGFRHELARQAVESTLLPARKRELHAQVLQALLDHSYRGNRGEAQVSLARLVHHAAQAEDGALVLRFAPEAARQASAQGAHREAAAHYETALRCADHLDARQRATLLDGLSYEYYLTGHIEEAIAPCEAALAIWRALGHQEQVGHNIRRLSRLSWFIGRVAEAERLGMEAVEVLETLPSGRELAMAYANLSHLRGLMSDTAQTALWGGRAIELAEQLQDTETLSYALNNLGTARLEDGDDGGWSQLERSLQIALERGYEEHVARAYTNLAANTIARRDYARATDYFQKGLAYCAEHDLGSWDHSLRGYQARTRLDQGDWAGATDDATAILATPWANGVNRGTPLLVLGRLRARRGDPGAEAALDEARELALAAGVPRTGVMDSVLLISEARAEWRWLQGDRDQCVAEAKAGLKRALTQHYPWYVGELAIWVWRGGSLHDMPAETPLPFAAQMAGDWRAAADAWEQIGCPYEQALALLDGDEPAQRRALAIFERLGAAPAAEMVRRRLRAAGARGLPRGPHVGTRENPHGLTTRQLEILLLLAEGLHNTEIADRLSTTLKTVEHHVSDILAKLGVRSRTEAVRVAYQRDLAPSPATPPPHNIGVR